jgi:hypothetical protein
MTITKNIGARKDFSRMEKYGQNCELYTKNGFRLARVCSMWVAEMARPAVNGCPKMAGNTWESTFLQMLLMKQGSRVWKPLRSKTHPFYLSMPTRLMSWFVSKFSNIYLTPKGQ